MLAWTRSAPAIEDRDDSGSETGGGIFGLLLMVAVAVVAVFVLTRSSRLPT